MRSTTQAALAFAGALAATIAVAQQPQTLRLRGVIEKVDGHTVLAKLTKGDEIKAQPRRQCSGRRGGEGVGCRYQGG